MFVVATDWLEDEVGQRSGPTQLVDREAIWAPDRILHAGTPIRRRPSAIMPGLRGVVTSSPAHGSSWPFLPNLDDAADTLDETASDNNSSTFQYFQNCRRPYNRIRDTPARTIFSISDTAVNEANPRPSNWIDEPLSVLKYVDDFLGHEKISVRSGTYHFPQNKPVVMVRAKICQDFFSTVSVNAAGVGISVNEKKTQMLCISAGSNEMSSFIETESERIVSQPKLKILGFTFGSKPSATAHLESVCTKFKTRLWLLRNLNKFRVPKEDLTKLYHVLIVPVLDYACVVYHYLLTSEQTHELEQLQSMALKLIWGFKHNYNDLLAMSDSETLHDRRMKMIAAFLQKSVNSERFRELWFPTKTFCHFNLRRERYYDKKYVRTDRLYNSPIYCMRRHLNKGVIPNVKPPDEIVDM